MVSLDDKVSRLRDEALHLVSNGSNVSHQTKVSATGFDEESDIVAAVVGYTKRCDGEVAHLESDAFLYKARQVGSHFLRDAVVLVDADVYLSRGIDGHLIVMAERANGLDMVCMVVSDEHMMYLRKTDAVCT